MTRKSIDRFILGQAAVLQGTRREKRLCIRDELTLQGVDALRFYRRVCRLVDRRYMRIDFTLTEKGEAYVSRLPS